MRQLSGLADLSCKEPFLVLHRRKVVVRPRTSFLPKVDAAIHLTLAHSSSTILSSSRQLRDISFWRTRAGLGCEYISQPLLSRRPIPFMKYQLDCIMVCKLFIPSSLLPISAASSAPFSEKEKLLIC
ncbi:hypothetical protein AB205_0178420 [Aquarana catesbeiana]|uniref:Uncharacterized protein n=1 Tax=Aquarana catesbeiana TaxID=8400 RepID=A0A2G9SE17_AQUCT|nr:hypothetical protein AB205_0178420 [Aquarana catesbeiana]